MQRRCSTEEANSSTCHLLTLLRVSRAVRWLPRHAGWPLTSHRPHHAVSSLVALLRVVPQSLRCKWWPVGWIQAVQHLHLTYCLALEEWRNACLESTCNTLSMPASSVPAARVTLLSCGRRAPDLRVAEAGLSSAAPSGHRDSAWGGHSNAPSCLLGLCVLETPFSKPIFSQRNDICHCVMHIVTSLLSTDTEGYCEKFNISNKNTSGLTGLHNRFSFIRE